MFILRLSILEVLKEKTSLMRFQKISSYLFLSSHCNREMNLLIALRPVTNLQLTYVLMDSKSDAALRTNICVA